MPAKSVPAKSVPAKSVPAKSVPFSFFSTAVRRMVNGKVVVNKALSSEYDGKKLRLNMCEGEKCKHEVFDNKLVKKILAKPVGDGTKSFFERLKAAKHKHKRTHKHKSKKTRHTKKK